jgi:hypothetical protein
VDSGRSCWVVSGVKGCIEPTLEIIDFGAPQDGVQRIKLIAQRNRTRAGYFRNEGM